MDYDNQYHYTLIDFERFICKSIEDNNLDPSLNKAKRIVDEKGLKGLAEYLFNSSAKSIGIPKYSDFIEAFEYFIKKENLVYEVQTVRHVICFKIDECEYLMDTYEGKTEELKYLIESKAYDEIYIMTNENIWSEIYLDSGIDKGTFIPLMLEFWEEYWDNLYEKIKRDVSKTNHLDSRKEKSWRQFQIFSESYNDIGDIIKFAFELDDFELYPIAVITMMNIFNADVCYNEYCECEFNTNDWESIWVKEDDNKPIFHIKGGDK